MDIIKINNSFICYEENQPKHLHEYYFYCLNKIKSELANFQSPINVLFCGTKHRFNNSNKVIKIAIQFEHTLVKEGGRDVKDKYFGNIEYENGKKYLVRIDQYDYLNDQDIIIDYSIPNLINIKESGHFDDFYKKMVYIPPLLYKQDFNNKTKQNTILLFNENSSDRRKQFINKLNMGKVKLDIIDNCFGNDELKGLYKSTKILVNVHQTDHHRTFEELRVLPALLNGVIIISEDVPLKDKIPYGNHIIWGAYDKISEKIIEVQNNYNIYYNKIFNNKLNDIILGLNKYKILKNEEFK
jgi:hypothetical protein